MATASPNGTFVVGGNGPSISAQTALVPLLESLIPGLSLMTGIFSSYFNIDITQYLLSLLVFLAIATGVKHCSQSLWEFVGEYLLSTAEIRYDDEMYNYLMYFVSKQSFSNRTTQFVAGTQTNSHSVWTDEDDENSADFEDEKWENSENQATNWDKVKELHFTPAVGTHFFRYRGSLLTFERRREDNQSWFGRSKTETIYLSCFGRNPQILKNLLQEAQTTYHERDGNRTVIYRASKSGGEEYSFMRCLSRAPRPMSSVVLDQDQKDMIVQDMKEYLHPYTRRWYSNRGIPYRRGYLFYGPPGTGKTSLCFSVAGLLGLRIYVISLNSRNMTEDSLANLFRDLPWRCIVLLEDIDSAGITAKREDKKIEATPEQTSPPTAAKGENTENNKGITLSGLLNVLDGISSSEGRVLCMTTNHKDNLDPALLRPGRVDMMVRFGFADKPMIEGIYQSIFFDQEARIKSQAASAGKITQLKASGHVSAASALQTPPPTPRSFSSTGRSEKEREPEVKERGRGSHFRHHDKSDAEIAKMASEFAEKMPAHEFSPAELQGYLLKHKNSPQAALDNIDEFVRETRAEKAEREKTEQKAKEESRKTSDETKDEKK